MAQTEFHEICYGTQSILFELCFTERNDLIIHVHPDLRVEVLAPLTSSLHDVFSKVKKRAAWICQQRRYFEQFQPLQPARQFVSGESHRYLGKQYRLKFIEARQESVKLNGGLIRVYMPPPFNSKLAKKLVIAWYRQRAQSYFLKKLKELQPLINQLGKEIPALKLRMMKSRWGSCSKSGEITLNPELIKAPSSCVRYVILHEVCHLVEHNHSSAFYALLEKFMPEWKKEKDKLNLMADLNL